MRRHDRLAGADVALQQPVHRDAARPCRARISSHTRSCAPVSAQGSAPRSRAHEIAARDSARCPRSRVVRERRIARPSCSSEEVLEGQAAVGRVERVLALREVRAAERLGQRREAAARRRTALGQRLGDVAGEGLDEAPHERPERPLRQPLGRRVDGHEPPAWSRSSSPELDQLPVLNLEADLARGSAAPCPCSDRAAGRAAARGRDSARPEERGGARSRSRRAGAAPVDAHPGAPAAGG